MSVFICSMNFIEVSIVKYCGEKNYGVISYQVQKMRYGSGYSRNRESVTFIASVYNMQDYLGANLER